MNYKDVIDFLKPNQTKKMTIKDWCMHAVWNKQNRKESEIKKNKTNLLVIIGLLPMYGSSLLSC